LLDTDMDSKSTVDGKLQGGRLRPTRGTAPARTMATHGLIE